MGECKFDFSAVAEVILEAARLKERIAAVERMVNADNFITVKDILVLLDIERKEKKDVLSD